MTTFRNLLRRRAAATFLIGAVAAALVGGGGISPALAAPPRITVDAHNVISVDGKKFLPIAVWAQPENDFPMWKQMGVNLFMASSHPVKSGTLDSYLKAAADNDVYVSIGYRWAKRENRLDAVMKNPHVFSIHHNDEPDKPIMVSDASLEPGTGMRVNHSRPLFTMVDGKLNTSAVIDPPQGVEFTLKLPRPVTVAKLALAVGSGNDSAPREVEFMADGQSVAKVEVENKKGLQEFPLKAPATFSALTVKVLSCYDGRAKFGTIAELQGFDAQGKNLLLSEAHRTATETPDQLMADYKAIKALDPDRLVSLCIMARFMPQVKFEKISDDMYKQYPPATDMIMFDLYPYSVYKGKHLDWNALGLDELRQLSGPKKILGIWLQASDAMGPGDPGLSPAQMRANVWLSLIHGATYIGYFPQTFNPNFKFNDLNADRRAALTAVNKEVTDLTDLILSPAQPDLFTVTPDGGRVDVMQRQQDNKALLVLVNVVESGPGKAVTVKIEPKNFKPAAVPTPRGAKQPLVNKDGTWSLELQPWETAVLVVDHQ